MLKCLITKWNHHAQRQYRFASKTWGTNKRDDFTIWSLWASESYKAGHSGRQSRGICTLTLVLAPFCHTLLILHSSQSAAFLCFLCVWPLFSWRAVLWWLRGEWFQFLCSVQFQVWTDGAVFSHWSGDTLFEVVCNPIFLHTLHLYLYLPHPKIKIWVQSYMQVWEKGLRRWLWSSFFQPSQPAGALHSPGLTFESASRGLLPNAARRLLRAQPNSLQLPLLHRLYPFKNSKLPLFCNISPVPVMRTDL